MTRFSISILGQVMFGDTSNKYFRSSYVCGYLCLGKVMFKVFVSAILYRVPRALKLSNQVTEQTINV